MKIKKWFSKPIIAYCKSKVLQNAPILEHSAIRLPCIKLTSVFKTFVLTIFDWPFKTGFTVLDFNMYSKWRLSRDEAWVLFVSWNVHSNQIVFF